MFHNNNPVLWCISSPTVSQVDVHQEYTWPKLWLMQVNWMGRIRHVMEAEDNHFQAGGHMLLQSMSSLGAWEIRLICWYFAFDIIPCSHGGGWLLSYNKIGCDYSDMNHRSRCGMSICVGHIMDALCHHCFISCPQFGRYRYICGSIDVSFQCPTQISSARWLSIWKYVRVVENHFT